MLAFLLQYGRDVAHSLLIFSILTALELLFPMGARNLRGRLGALVFWAAWLGAGAALLVAEAPLWDLLGAHRLVLPLSHLIARTGLFAPVTAMLTAAMVGDFFFYWFHRAQHAFFWKYHAVHHAIEDLNAVNSYHHISEPVFTALFISLPMSLLFVDVGLMLPMATLLISLQGVYIHSPTALNFGPLRYLLADNRYHRIHHGRALEYHDRNFAAAFPFWDVLFGTVRWPQKDEWPAAGLIEVSEPTSIREWVDLPFRLSLRRPQQASGSNPGRIRR